MKYLKHKEIDEHKWDRFLKSLPKVHYYFLYNYLSNICNWDAIVVENNNEYELILPIPFKRKLWLKYFYQPFFCQQLGIKTKNAVSKYQIQKIRKILKKEFSFGLANWGLLDVVNEEFNVIEKINYTLSLDKDYSVLKQNYSTNRKRVLNKLGRNSYSLNTSNEIVDINNTISRFSQLFKTIIPEIKTEHYESLKLALKAIRNSCSISVYNVEHDDEILASALFIVFQDRIIYLLGYTEESHRKESVQSLIFEELIRTHQNSTKLLDFEGGSASGVGRFYSSFGGLITPYSQLNHNEKHLIFRKIFR